mgnify:CR=1 FL=1
MKHNFEQYTKGTYSRTVMYMMGILLMMLMLGFLFSGCSEFDSVAGGETGNENDNATISSKVETSDNPSATMNISEAKFLLRDVKFRRTDGSEGEIKVGPIVVNLDMSGNIRANIRGSIPAGTFNRLRFKIHKPEDNEVVSDPDFKEGTSGSRRYSVVAKGTYNGAPFVYKSRKSINMELALQGAFTIEQGQDINVTIIMDPYQWFRSGSDYLDPSNENNENTIDDKLRDAFKRVFLDNDLNGQP